ncbi:MAG: TIGR02186 family protein [Rickettsiales bacterium]|nr:TIGR02186 family protein [Rickettsiales bacterium]
MSRLLLVLLLLLPVRAWALSPVVADLSNYSIEIDSGFNGTRIFVFGARNDNGDIVVIVRGPNKNFMVRKKESMGGIWINRSRMKFYNVPDFYAVAASKPLEEIEQSGLFDRLSIGQATLLTPPPNVKQKDSFEEFQGAFLRHQTAKHLYADAPEKVNFMAETLFKTVIEFPDNIPSGMYTAEIYLISDGEVVGMQSTPIRVVKGGLDAFVYQFAHRQPVLYGLTAIALALFAGWAAGKLFNKYS